MTVYTSNLVIHTGTYFEQTFVFESETSNYRLDLTGYTACARLKKYESSSPAATFEIAFTSRYLGKIRLSLTETATANLKPGKYFYDVLLNDGSKIIRVIEGQATVKKAVTRI